MVVIRLSRGGAKKRPFYHIVVADKCSPRDGRNIERVGYYNPIARGAEVPLRINLERVNYWKSVGAQTSHRVANLLKKYEKTISLPPEVAKSEAPQTAAAKD